MRKAVNYVLTCVCYGFREYAWKAAMEGELSDFKGLIHPAVVTEDGKLEDEDMHLLDMGILETIGDPIVKQMMTSRRKVMEFNMQYKELNGFDVQKPNMEAELIGCSIYNKLRHLCDLKTKTRKEDAIMVYHNMQFMLMQCAGELLDDHQDDPLKREESAKLLFRVVEELSDDEYVLW